MAETGQVHPVLVLVPVASRGHAAGASNRTNGSKCIMSHSSGGKSGPGDAHGTGVWLAALQSCSGAAPQPRGSERPCCPPVSWPQTGSWAVPGVATALAELLGESGVVPGQLPPCWGSVVVDSAQGAGAQDVGLAVAPDLADDALALLQPLRPLQLLS